MMKDVREAYDLWAESYDSQANVTRDLDGVLLRRDLADRDLGDVLELGCGTGKNTRWLVERGSVRGLDVSEAMMARCRNSCPAADLRHADLRLPWPVDKNSVDGVVASLVLEHIEDLGHIAAEAARVLRNGGWVRVSELHPARQQIGKSAHFFRNGQRIEPAAYLHATEDYTQAFERHGFLLQSRQDARRVTDSGETVPRLLVMRFSLTTS